MRRFVPLIPAALFAAGTLLSAACATAGPARFACSVQDGSATVSSATGVFGPPNFDAVDRDYTVHAVCPSLSDPQNQPKAAVRANASYSPTSQTAREEISARGFDLVTTWSACTGDPWLTADVTCTNQTWDQREGKLSNLVANDKSAPLSAQILGVTDRSKIAQELFVDFSQKDKQFPNTCTGASTEFGSVVAEPTGDQVFHRSSSIPLNVSRLDGCTVAIDKVQPFFELQWQVQDPSDGQFHDISLVSTFDGVANPNGTSIAASKFAPFTTGFAPTTFRVRARLTKTNRPATFSDYVQFIVDPF